MTTCKYLGEAWLIPRLTYSDRLYLDKGARGVELDGERERERERERNGISARFSAIRRRRGETRGIVSDS